MFRRLLITAGCLASLAGYFSNTNEADAGDPYAMTQVWAHNYAMDRPWHGGYYYQNSGVPQALVVPPTAHMRQTLSWGVSQNLMYPIHHQYGRSAGAPASGAQGRFRATPHWPSHTDQFGVYYVRGPW